MMMLRQVGRLVFAWALVGSLLFAVGYGDADATPTPSRAIKPVDNKAAPVLDEFDAAWRKQITELESRLFGPVMTADEARRLLLELTEPETRENAAKRLAEQGQGHVDEVIGFARKCPDMEARQACVEIVEALDSSYRTTDLGKRLGAVYREHAKALLPIYWARFRKDPLDPRAVAMLMHADAEKVYEALGKTGDRHDRLRYLLLRIRELTPDKFAAEHIEEHTAPGVWLALPDVFPIGAHCDGPIIRGRTHRAVGQTYLNVIRICASREIGTPPRNNPFGGESASDGLPGVRYVSLARRWINMFHDRHYVIHWKVDVHMYSSRAVRKTGNRRGYPGPHEGLCPLPTLILSSEHRTALLFQQPWWLKSYLPTVYRETLSFTKPKPGEKPPEAVAARFSGLGTSVATRVKRPAAPLDPTAPSVVIMPLRLPKMADSSAIAAAELVCDRLAEELAAEGIARVVDRDQLDRVLREKRLSADLTNPMLSFDALVRLEVDAPSLLPKLRLSLIDLSHGNVMKEENYDWPVQEVDLPKMAGQCRDGLKQVGRPNGEKLKVRCLKAENQERNPRLTPLLRRLRRVFDEAVAGSDRLAPVRHLEAASTKEESLLLLMGLSRLPGGRKFVPQADATIELLLREGDGRGKTFEDTPVEITVRVIRGDSTVDQSLSITGKVGQFDRAAVEAWEKLAAVLREAQPGAAADWLDEMAVRRRQAEAELRAAKAAVLEDSATAIQGHTARLAHAEAAMKLDPSFEDAAYEQLESLSYLCFYGIGRLDQGRMTDTAERFLTHATRYFEQFGPTAKYRNGVHDACYITIHRSLGSVFSSGSIDLTPQRLRMIALTKRILEYSVQYDARSPRSDYQAMALMIVGRAMRQTGIPVAVREEWVDSILRQCDSNEAALPKLSDDASRETRHSHNRIWVRAAELAVEDGRIDRAKKLVAHLRERLATGLLYEVTTNRLRVVMVKMDDAAAVAEFDRWVKESRTKAVSPLHIRWPQIKIFDDREMVHGNAHRHATFVGYRIITPPVEGVTIRHAPLASEAFTTRITALAEGGGRAYLMMVAGLYEQRRQVLAYVPLDQAGKPLGKTYRADNGERKEYWDSLELLPKPQVTGQPRVIAAKFLAGKLFLGTARNGLLVFDPKTEKWAYYTPKQGLPGPSVSAIYPLDEDTIFCSGEINSDDYHFKLHLPSGRVTLLYKEKEQQLSGHARYFWRHDDKLMAWCATGMWKDLLSPKATFHVERPQTFHGWKSTEYPRVRGVAEIDRRLFLMSDDEVHEFDRTGKVIRSWCCGRLSHTVDAGPLVSLTFPAQCPAWGRNMTSAGSLLVFSGYDEAIVAYEPSTDIWYGPLKVSRAESVLGTRAGLWVGTHDGVVFVSVEDLLSTARKEGRALTTDQCLQRKEEIIAALPPLEQAKVAFVTRRFDVAEELLEQILKEDPEAAEALLLTGHLHDVWCTNRPEEAHKYYQRLAELNTNQRASLAGLYLKTILLTTEKRWPEAQTVIESIRRDFPHLHDFTRRNVDSLQAYIRKQLAEKDGKQPAAETSNKEEGPAN